MFHKPAGIVLSEFGRALPKNPDFSHLRGPSCEAPLSSYLPAQRMHDYGHLRNYRMFHSGAGLTVVTSSTTAGLGPPLCPTCYIGQYIDRSARPQQAAPAAHSSTAHLQGLCTALQPSTCCWFAARAHACSVDRVFSSNLGLRGALKCPPPAFNLNMLNTAPCMFGVHGTRGGCGACCCLYCVGVVDACP